MAQIGRYNTQTTRWQLFLPLAGALLGAALWGGLMLLRYLEGNASGDDWLQVELFRNGTFYDYVLYTSVPILAFLGWLHGRALDTIRSGATLDPLTGLVNQRYFVERLAEELVRSKRHQLPVAMLLIDVDNMKRINEGGGHKAGDVALQAVARALRQTSRVSDLPARLGGDEFAILATQTTAEQAVGFARRIHEALEAIWVPWPKMPQELTVSVGITDLEQTGYARPELMYKSARSAVVAAKAAGRNTASVADGASGTAPAPSPEPAPPADELAGAPATDA